MSATTPSPSAARILLVDYDSQHAGLLAKHLRGKGYTVSRVETSLAILSSVLALDADILVLHLDDTGQSAQHACAVLRGQGSRLPILTITSSASYSSRVALLVSGSDDVMSRPYAIEELIARLEALLRRARMGMADIAGPSLEYADLHVDTNQRSVFRGGERIKLTVKEYDLLLCLLRHPQQILARQHLLRLVWGDTWVGDDNLLDVYIRYLRKKLDVPAGAAKLIHTVRGVGFVLR